MSRRNQPSGCGTVLGIVIAGIVIAVLDPVILEILWFVLFLILAAIVNIFS